LSITSARELVVPWSRAKRNFGITVTYLGF
jgi:hypothetical protein